MRRWPLFSFAASPLSFVSLFHSLFPRIPTCPSWQVSEAARPSSTSTSLVSFAATTWRMAPSWAMDSGPWALSLGREPWASSLVSLDRRFCPSPRRLSLSVLLLLVVLYVFAVCCKTRPSGVRQGDTLSSPLYKYLYQIACVPAYLDLFLHASRPLYNPAIPLLQTHHGETNRQTNGLSNPILSLLSVVSSAFCLLLLSCVVPRLLRHCSPFGRSSGVSCVSLDPLAFFLLPFLFLFYLPPSPHLTSNQDCCGLSVSGHVRPDSTIDALCHLFGPSLRFPRSS